MGGPGSVTGAEEQGEGGAPPLPLPSPGPVSDTDCPFYCVFVSGTGMLAGRDVPCGLVFLSWASGDENNNKDPDFA